MKFHILTIFPDIFRNNPYFEYSIVKRAIAAKKISIEAHDIRDWAEEPHKKTDDIPYGGGPGMVMKVGPIWEAVKAIRKKEREAHVVLFSTRGKKLDTASAERLSKYASIVFICGRYEGVDERVAEHIADEEMSIGDFVLAGGELPAMVATEVIARFVPGVLGKNESLESVNGSHPGYTRPEIFVAGRGKKWQVPEVLLSGNHKKIAEWRKEKGEGI